MATLRFAIDNLLDGVGFDLAGTVDMDPDGVTPAADTEEARLCDRSNSPAWEGSLHKRSDDLLTNGDFSGWTGDDPDSWTVVEVGDSTSNITEDTGDCEFISDGTAAASIAQTILEVGEVYDIDIVVATDLGGTLEVYDGATKLGEVTATGTTSFTGITATGTVFKINTKASESTDITVSSVVVKEVYDNDPWISVENAAFDSDSYLPDALILPEGHNLDGAALQIRKNTIAGGIATSTLVTSWTQSGTGTIVKEFSTTNAEQWFLVLDTDTSLDAAIPEIFFTRVVDMERPPSRPGEAQEDTFNVRNEVSSGGFDRFLDYGAAKKQRNYFFPNIGENDKDLLLALWDTWAGKNPFWMCDHDGTWIFVKFVDRLEMREIAYQRYSCKVNVLEVL